MSKDEAAELLLRDFIYLDVDRVKSLLAQIDQGLLTDLTDTSGTSQAVEGGGSIKVPMIGELGGKGEYIWHNQATQTRTLHDYIYNQTEVRLIELGRVVRLPMDVTEGHVARAAVRDRLGPVSYILARGRPLISDFGALGSLLSEFNDLGKMIAEMSVHNQLQGLSGPARATALKHLADTIKRSQMDPKMQKSLTKLVETFYGDRLVFKMLPFTDPNVRIVGPLRQECLRDRLEDIRFKYGSAPTGQWTVFGQVAHIPSEEPEPEVQGQHFSNQLEGAFDSMFATLRGLERFFGVSYPEIAITPIAVYRD